MRAVLSLLRPLLLLGAVMPSAQALPDVTPSTVTLPVTVAIAGVQAAANARVPDVFASVQEERSFLGGLLSVQVQGEVRRAGPVSVSAAPDGQSLVIRVPVQAAFRASPGGRGAFLERSFGGAATVALTVTPVVTPAWEAGVRVAAASTWTDPLSVELAPGARVSVQALVDRQVQAQLERVAAEVERAVREGAALRDRAGRLWARAQQPWALPTPEPSFARVTPVALRVTPFHFTPDALTVTVGASVNLSAGLGRAGPVTPSPLPPLVVSEDLGRGVHLTVPVTLPYAALSEAATRYAAPRTLVLPVPTRPVLRVTGVTFRPVGARLGAVVAAQVSGPLGLRVRVTVDVTGTPVLDSAAQTLTLPDVTVTTRRDGLTGRVVGWLADARAQAYLSRAAHVDVSPLLERARAHLQARLPFVPVAGVQVSGAVQRLTLQSALVTPQAVVVTASATGDLRAHVDASALVGAR